MASKSLAKGLKRSALTVALGFCFIGGVQAQSNAAGAVAGRAASGDTITVENPSTGFSRTITVTGDGSYRFSALPTGNYTVTRKTADGATATRNATVQLGSAANVDFVRTNAAGDAQTLDTVTVVGAAINPIDVSSVESTTILTGEQIAKIPVARDVTSVALLAPGTVRGDAAFGNLASFGGASVAENAYFVNGFNITNAFKNLAFAQLPFEAIGEQQTKTGGYGAEFGRALGGVVNVVTKRGTNEFHAGGNLFYLPSSLRGRNPNRYTNGGINTGTAGPAAPTATVEPSYLFENNGQDEASDNGTAAIWASGALIKDRLFAYGLLQYNRTSDAEAYGGVGAVRNTSTSSKSPTWLLKMDWNISDDHLLELTTFSDKRETEVDVFNNLRSNAGNPVIQNANNVLVRTNYLGTQFTETGGETYSLKYTGYLTDTFTLSAMYGHAENSRSDYGIAANGVRTEYTGVLGDRSGCPAVTENRAQAGRNPLVLPQTCNFIPGGLLGSPNNKDERDQFRIDAEWVLGDHRLRAGFDADRFKSFDAESREGGVLWQIIANDTAVENIFQTGAQVEVNSDAVYIEDNWNVTDNFLAYIGLRWDNFENINGSGQTFVEVKNQFQPRLGFSWDVNGDSTFKVFGNAGRYALPLTATVAIRGASASLFRSQEFTFSGFDPRTGAPTNLVPVPASINFSNNEFGVAKDAISIASQNIEPMYQDEYILGFQQKLNENISLGVRGIYRDLKRAIDDQCDYRAVRAWATQNGFTVDPATDGFQTFDPANPREVSFYNAGFPFCRLYNPGSDGEFNMDVNGDGKFELVKIPADVLGPKAKRKYNAVEFFFDSQWNDRFFLQGSYTFARSKGNTEGGVKSDIGQDDTGTTQDFDYPELTQGSYGYLPNDRRHSLKLFGNYEVTEEWAIGGSFIAQSGRPVNCFGVLGQDPVHYNTSYFSCSQTVGVNEVNDAFQRRRNNGSDIVSRGTSGRTPWTRDLSLNVSYTPSFLEGLMFKIDVFNVFGEDEATTVNEFGELAGGMPAGFQNYKQPTGFQAPRSYRFLVQYEF